MAPRRVSLQTVFAAIKALNEPKLPTFKQISDYIKRDGQTIDRVLLRKAVDDCVTKGLVKVSGSKYITDTTKFTEARRRRRGTSRSRRRRRTSRSRHHGVSFELSDNNNSAHRRKRGRRDSTHRRRPIRRQPVTVTNSPDTVDNSPDTVTN